MHCYVCGGLFHWRGSKWLIQVGCLHNWEAAPILFLSPGWFKIVQLKLCLVWLALSGWLPVNSKKMFLLLSGHFGLYLDLVLGSPLLSAPVGGLWIRNLVMYTDEVSAVVWLGWGVGMFGVRLSRSLVLRCQVVLLCNTFSVLFRSIGPMSSLELPHIWLGVLIWGGPRPFNSFIWSQNCLLLGWYVCLCLGVSIVLGWFILVHSRRCLDFPWALCVIWYLLAPVHTFSLDSDV